MFRKSRELESYVYQRMPMTSMNTSLARLVIFKRSIGAAGSIDSSTFFGFSIVKGKRCLAGFVNRCCRLFICDCVSDAESSVNVWSIFRRPLSRNWDELVVKNVSITLMSKKTGISGVDLLSTTCLFFPALLQIWLEAPVWWTRALARETPPATRAPLEVYGFEACRRPIFLSLRAVYRAQCLSMRWYCTSDKDKSHFAIYCWWQSIYSLPQLPRFSYFSKNSDFFATICPQFWSDAVPLFLRVPCISSDSNRTWDKGKLFSIINALRGLHNGKSCLCSFLRATTDQRLRYIHTGIA